MINIFEKDDCYIITLIPQTEEETEYLLKGQRLLSREEEIREQEEKAGAGLAVELEPLHNFYLAEEYHQKYLDKNPGGYCHIPGSYFQLGKK